MSQTCQWLKILTTVSVYLAILVYLVVLLIGAVWIINYVAPLWSFFHTFEVFSLAAVVTFPLWSIRRVRERIKPLVPQSLVDVPPLAILAGFVYALAHLLRVVLGA